MRRTIFFYFLTVIAGVFCYSCATISWISSKTAGPHAFPGSPDWGYMYGSSLESYFWMSGMLFGLVLGGVALFASARVSKSDALGRWSGAMIIGSIVVPLAALVVGCVAEWNAVQGTSIVGYMHSNQSLEPTSVGKPPSVAQLQR